MIKTIRMAMLLGISMIAVVWLTGCATPLHRAVESGNLAEAERLIKEGADVNAYSDDLPPLYYAVLSGKKEMVELLIANGADVNAKYNNGHAPLHEAAFGGQREVAELLISKGADVNAKSENGYTPLYYAERYGKHEVASYLRDIMSGKVRVAIPAPAEDPKEAAVFEAEAKKYRALVVKPELPEEARRFNVQAVAAFKDKQFKEAAESYANALKAAPWWPEGHFNRALILGELNRFAEAIREMKRYLQVVPDAPNARAAQDKIYEWERFTSK